MSTLGPGSREDKHRHLYAPLSETDSAGAVRSSGSSLHRPQPLSRLSQHCLSFFSGVLITSLFFLFCTTRSISGLSRAHLATTDAESPVPPLPFSAVTFKENETFVARPSIETNHAWNALLPPGRGFVFVNSPEKYNLKPGQSTKHGQIYSVSVFHQLHCLAQLRKAHWTLIEGVETGETRPSKLLLGEGGKHIAHCLDYLRQSIMCAGDMTMEWPRTEPNGERYAVDGWGIPHQCKSWDAISHYMQQAHFNGSMNAEIAPS